jgi:putative ABC transport system permease protein
MTAILGWRRAWSALSVALSTAIDALLRNPLRALLTGFGILVGVLSVTVVITLGEGAERAVQQRIDKLGENLITVVARAAQASGARNDTPTLVEADAKAMAASLGDVVAVAPVLDGLVRAVYREKNTPAQAVGTTSAYFRARNYYLEEGTIWDLSQENTSARVVLVGPTVVQELFSGESPLGESIRIGRHLFSVIGVLSEKGQTPFGTDQDNVVVMPLGTMRSKVAPGRPGEVRQIAVAAKKDANLDEVKRSISSLIRQRHHIGPSEGDDFSVRDQARMAETQKSIVGVMRMLLLSIAAVSLAIGGIGVMNIMLVGVAERSKEIGTRMAVGARGTDILIQFLIESVVLSLLGGALGAGLAGALLSPLEDYFGWELSLSTNTLLVAFLVSVSIGVVFGMLPARRAARLDPVVALRSE